MPSATGGQRCFIDAVGIELSVAKAADRQGRADSADQDGDVGKDCGLDASDRFANSKVLL